MRYAQERLRDGSIVDNEGDVKPESDYIGLEDELLMIPDAKVFPMPIRAIQPAYDYEDGEDPHSALGGLSTELTPSQEVALYRIGLGKPEMRARVEARLAEEQRRINKAGAHAVHQAGVRVDAARGVDTTSSEYRAKRRLQADRRSRRA